MNRVLRRSIQHALIAAALCVVADAQEGQRPRDASGVGSPSARGVAPAASSGALKAWESVDENFELNIAERRITERDFFASTSIETEAGSAGGLSLRVGVAVGASEIDLLLRNVRGRVRFRGSLDALRRVLDARREPAAPPPQNVP
jgi:hypothetical protein